MDPKAVLAAFDDQMRRRARVLGDEQIEHEDQVTRVISGEDGWSGVLWSDIDERTADAVIAAQVRRFAKFGRSWEWKHYSYDQPRDLPERLMAAGFQREPSEGLLVAKISDLELEMPPPPGVEIRAVVDKKGVDALVWVHDQVFGPDHAPLGKELLSGLCRQPGTLVGLVAFAGQQPVAAGRLALYVGTEFAGLWGGGTLPAWRRRGVFRSLVAHRAALAAQSGFRYLQVDGGDESRPILERLGFAALATTTPFIHSGRIG